MFAMITQIGPRIFEICSAFNDSSFCDRRYMVADVMVITVLYLM
ncbi:putative DNA methyltransferase [Xanthomonas phage FoX7]|uniref:Putative DNA methyltransferase n=2 Tax=Carpasinavirus XcP1 TaxID=2182344 RepID=A0A858NY03_9CAUD|nr:putative DNA methyltransferase [Xanthomonas phage FoX6]QJB22166.1 putative DNA methyltransferase [Xanthomonas phage FoX7]